MALRHKVCRDKRQKKHTGGQKNYKTKQNSLNIWDTFYLGKKILIFLLWGSLGFKAAFVTLCQWVIPENFDTIWSLRSPLQILMVKWVLVGYLWSSNMRCRFPGTMWMPNSVAAGWKGLLYLLIDWLILKTSLASSSFLHTRLVTVILVLCLGAKVP